LVSPLHHGSVNREEIKTTPGERPIDQPAMWQRLDELIVECGGNPDTPDGRLIRNLLSGSLKLVTDGRDTGELKLLANSLLEMRHAMRVFGDFETHPKVSVFGSARTPSDHPDYRSAVEFAALMSRHGWLTITGAGDGIMKAGHEGSGRDAAFGLAIRLPFETTANSVIAGDVKLVNFRYFFTRKTMFLSQSAAVVAFPGGFGTLDEVMESLTLIQTGKAQMMPVVLLAGAGSTYWQGWEEYVSGELASRGFISPHDADLYYHAESPMDAVAHILRFYANYHSARYVGDDYVIRVRRELSDSAIALLNDEYADIVAAGAIVQREAYGVEGEHLDLPRIAFTHTRRDYARVRRLIDRINDLALAERDAELAAKPTVH
jgi:uncharacterized protein (TIGR00730 family)